MLSEITPPENPIQHREVEIYECEACRPGRGCVLYIEKAVAPDICPLSGWVDDPVAVWVLREDIK